MESSAENDQRVMTIVTMAMQQAPAGRESYLRLACADDQELYREVSAIVNGEESMGGFLLQPMITFKDFPKPFEPGQVISGRFEIIREIGEGGMGVVYEAFDRKRGLRIAIKSAKPGFQRLLSPELEGALTVRHSNVCRVNEIHTAETDHGDVDFLTMELLEGETLSARLAARGRLTALEALELARQLCAGLAEAHRSGVIHRDLKSANIILCPGGSGNLRAVITDFGLAGSSTQSDGFAGTPGYMAPELLRGESASKASDIYALGVILYEMVTGRRPFDDEFGDSMARSPAPPSTFARKLPARCDRTILRCLEPLPSARPADTAEILAGLEQRAPHRASVLALALLALAGASLALPQVREWVWPPPNVRLVMLPAVGSADSGLMAGGVLQDVADRIGHMRSGRRAVAVISPLEAQNLQVQTPQQAREVLHATHALETTLRREGDKLVARVSVIDLDTQVHLREFSGQYSPATYGKLPAALAGEVSVALRLQAGSDKEVLSSAATPPYDRGLYLLRKDNESYEEAVPLFQEAARLDQRSAWPLAGLAEAEVMKFGLTKQRRDIELAQQSLRSAESLNPDSARVRLVAGLVNKTMGQYEKALEDYRRVLDLEPRNAEAFVRMATVYDLLDQPDKAIDSFRKAIALEPGYYSPYLQLGVFYYYRGKYLEAVEQFRKAIECAPGLYDAYTDLGAALNYLGRDAEAEEALLASLKLRETPRALNSLGAIRAYHQRDADAVGYYERAITLNPHNYVYLVNLGDSNRRLGRLAQAHEAYGKAMELALAELNQDPRGGLARANVAYLAARLGDTKRAEEEVGQALKLSPGDSMVIRKAALTYVALRQKDRAMEVLTAAAADVLHELDRHPDFAGFRQDSRFQELTAKTLNGGK